MTSLVTTNSYYCYIISNDNDRTYNGYTVNLERRLRQHNGHIQGGAKTTRGKGPWSFLVVITSECWDCISTAMRHEWSIKYPTRKRPRPKEYNGVIGRLMSLTHVFQHMQKMGCEKVICHVREGHLELMQNISQSFSSFVSVCPLNVSELSTRTLATTKVINEYSNHMDSIQ